MEKELGVYHTTVCTNNADFHISGNSQTPICASCAEEIFGEPLWGHLNALALIHHTGLLEYDQARTCSECYMEAFTQRHCARHAMPKILAKLEEQTGGIPPNISKAISVVRESFPELRPKPTRESTYHAQDYLPKISPDGEEIDHLAHIAESCRQDGHLLSMVYPPYAELAELGRLAARGVATNPERVAYLKQLCQQKGLIACG